MTLFSRGEILNVFTNFARIILFALEIRPKARRCEYLKLYDKVLTETRILWVLTPRRPVNGY
jgi:hypothetical protein